MIDDAQRIAVGRRLRAGLRRNDAASAAAIFDDERLAETRLQFGSGLAHNDVGHAAGGDRDDQTDRTIRIDLCLRRTGEADQQQAEECLGDPLHNVSFPQDFL